MAITKSSHPMSPLKTALEKTRKFKMRLEMAMTTHTAEYVGAARSVSVGPVVPSMAQPGEEMQE
jgi:hypothetical protein